MQVASLQSLLAFMVCILILSSDIFSLVVTCTDKGICKNAFVSWAVVDLCLKPYKSFGWGGRYVRF